MIALNLLTVVTLATTSFVDNWSLDIAPGLLFIGTKNLDTGVSVIPVPTLLVEPAYRLKPWARILIHYDNVFFLKHRLGTELQLTQDMRNSYSIGIRIRSSIGGYGVHHDLSNWLTGREYTGNIGGIDLSTDSGLIVFRDGKPAWYVAFNIWANYLTADWHARGAGFVDRGWYVQGTQLTGQCTWGKHGIRVDIYNARNSDGNLLLGDLSLTLSALWHLD